MKLLVADDEDTIRKGVSNYIKKHSDRFEKIYEAENGQEALDIILNYHPEVLLLDVQMPIMTGLEVMKTISNGDYHPVIIILSGYDEFSYAQQAVKYGANEYLLKPIRATEILDCINRLADERYKEGETGLLKSSGQNSDDSKSANHIATEARAYISEHYMDNLSLSSVAEELGISGGYLSTLFTQNFDCGFVDYLNQIRIDRACVYLEQTYLKTYEIAYKVGFKDEKYFSKVFKKLTGVSPREYRSSNYNSAI